MLSLGAAAFWSGILWATTSRQVIDARTGTAFLIAGILVLATAALAGSRSRSPAASVITFLAVYLSFGLLGAGWGGIRDDRVRSSPVAALAGRSVRGIGTIAATPEPG